MTKSFSETIKKKVKGQKSKFLTILFGKLRASLLGNLLPAKNIIRADEGTIRPGQDF